MNFTAISSFLFFICLVSTISIVKARRKKSVTAEVMPSKRTYNFVAVGCALFFTNISAAEFIGGSEAAYTNNMTTMAWGVSSVFAMLLVSEFIIPIYMRGAISTTPDFLAMRYDNSTKLLVTLIFLLSYVFNLLPIILYTGAVALNGLFHFQSLWHISYPAAVWLLVIVLGIIGCAYTVMGGLKVIVVSDILLGLCLFAGGVLLAYFGLKYVGDGSWQQGLQQIVTTHTEHLNAIGSETDAVPFSGIFTGMFLINLFYWGTEQVIVQQALSARDLQASQKGIALACFGKLAGPLLFMLPGIIAVQVYGNMPNTIEVFPKLVSGLTPPMVCGFIAAIVFGAAIISFSQALNSVGTLFTLNLYKPYMLGKNKQVANKALPGIAKKIEIAATFIAMLIAPLIIFSNSIFYTYMQKANATFSIPIFTIMLVGFTTKRVPPLAAKCGLIFCATGYLLTQFVFDTGLHFLHVLPILFVLTILLMLMIGKLKPMPVPYTPIYSNAINLKPWQHRHWVSAALLVAMVAMFVIFSRWGLVK